MISYRAISTNIIDVVIIFAQVYTFYIKLTDSSGFDVEMKKMLFKENRDRHTNFYFLARNFKAQINVEAISLIFIVRKILNSFRIIKKYNTIFTILDNAG